MDLVDIDQVLDNLELREAADENNKVIAVQHQQSSTGLESSAVGLVSNASTAINPHINNSNSTGATGSTGSASKCFIGVSQVFNSLDDYRKNVESLETAALQKYDEECRPIADSAANRKENIQSEYQSYDSNSCLNTSTTSLHSTEEVARPSEFEDLDQHQNQDREKRYEEVEDDYDEDDESNDIHKFRENAGTHNTHNSDEAEDCTTTSSDSLTTSSSSTFSSGPSPGVASTTEEHEHEQLTPSASPSPSPSPSSPPPAIDEEECTALLTSEQAAIKHDAGTEAASEPSKALAQTEQQDDSVNSVLVSQNNGEFSGAGLDELAYGLSSISITTTADLKSNFNCEPTVSSALGNVLEELTETTSTSLLSQLREELEVKRKQVSAKPAEKRHEEGHEANNKTKTKIRLTDNKLPYMPAQEHAATKYQQPITFGSTMDEISDTELDSMLQDMEIDELTEENTKITSQQAAANIACNLSTDEAKIVEETAEAVEELEVSTVAVDNLNADSFSQASTVEFSEIRAQVQRQPTQAEEIANDQQQSNSVASSYSSSDSSSLDAEAIGTANCTDKDGDPEECSKARPKRPTTLNLPTLAMNLYANAGQTPPGNTVVESEDFASAEKLNSASPEEQQMSTTANGIPVDKRENAESNPDYLQQNDNHNDTDIDVAPHEIAEATGYSDPHANLGKIPPIWIPDNMATNCMQCQSKFTMIKRRHHCRACGKVLCSLCCSQKFKLEFLANPETRVCVQCYLILAQRQQAELPASGLNGEIAANSINNETTPAVTAAASRSPNPNNPMEYCSTIPPHRQVSNTTTQPPSVIVPVGVLKKDGSYSSNSSNSSSKKGRKRKSVMFSDGIAPGSDLASLEHQEAKQARRVQGDKQRNAASNKPATPGKTEASNDATTMGLVASLFRGSIPPVAAAAAISIAHGSSVSAKSNKSSGDAEKASSSAVSKADALALRSRKLPPSGCDEYGCFIPKSDNCLPPIYMCKDDSTCDFDYKEVTNNFELIERLQRESLKFAVTKNFFVLVKIVNLKCCMNRTVINFTTSGMHHVGNDEIIVLLEFDIPASKEFVIEPPIPKDIFTHLHEIYREAEHGSPIAELSYTSPQQSNFLGSREYGGFIFIRSTFQCLQDIIVPENPFLIAILIHRCEVPWAKVFPLRLMLRLGAQYRYYPCPHISMRNRESVYAEIAQTIINFLADFRNYSYTLPSIRGMYIHMEDRQTTVLIPRNRQEDVIKAINNSSDHILAFGGNFSKIADGHLVCMQNVNDERAEMYSYSTQAINIQGQPRKVTGASFFVLNEALKSTSGLSGKCSIVEDGLMVQILPSKMEDVRNALRNQRDIDIVCGPIDADQQQAEIVKIKWIEKDSDFNIGVKSPIDDKSMEGVSSMRVHASFNYSNANYSIRLTDIYILKFDDWYNSAEEQCTTSMNITRIAEQIARSASMALVPFLDLLIANGNFKIGLRTTLHQDSVCYEAGTRGIKLPPLYMNALDNHLVPTLHNESTGIENAIILELIFHILNV